MKQHTYHKKAIIIFGHPGAGKSTQGILLAEKLGMYHFNAGRVLEQIIYDPKNKKNKKILQEQEHFEHGELMSTSFVMSVISKKVKDLARNNESIIFSSNPRTYQEAFGKGGDTGLIHLLKKHYGEKNIASFLLKVSEKESLKRNSNRLMCSVCGTPILTATLPKGVHLSACPFCGGKVYRRTLDDPNIIAVRFKEYREKTEPIIQEMQVQGVPVRVINGALPPYKILATLLKHIHETFKDGE